MDDERWIVVPNWDRFQHYSDRTPPWIKLYTELNRRDDWRSLSYAARGALVSIWIEYAAVRGQVRVSTLGGVCGQKTDRRTLKSLSDAGWIHLVASKPLAQRREEKKREEQGAHAPKPKSKKPSPEEAKVNAAAYRRYDPDEPFDYEAALARLSEQAGR